ncbi:MAG: hypothetical protein M4579_000583 [Chaenotheca gracillima]|nr:MAG: hypothetical protein M4579_000583 [Chaenotheca gracillima]
MATQAELQTLLRFLSQDAKVPLAMAMGKIKTLQERGLNSIESISKTDTSSLQSIFPDPKISKQILNAAKRLSKKRTASDTNPSSSSPSSSVKRKKPISGLEPMTPAAIEESLALPESVASEEEISKTSVYTNRAPLVLAFAVSLIKYTMPEQPLSSRLSLAQAVVSANSNTKARSLGLESGRSAEEEGWGQGQPTVKIMGREISVLKRWGYEWRAEDQAGHGEDHELTSDQNSRADSAVEQKDTKPALWGIDLEAFRSSNKPGASDRLPKTAGDLPIYTAQSARTYLLKSLNSAPSPSQSSTTPKKKSATKAAEEREDNLGLLLKALDQLFESWIRTLGTTELDRRAWSWYVHVRPEIRQGVAGWGEKGEVKLAEILDLRRKL